MNEESDQDPTAEPKWPRDITIRATVETARLSLGGDYDEDHEGDDALLNEIGESMETIEIGSWEELDIPNGYEIADDDDRGEYDAWRESNRNG